MTNRILLLVALFCLFTTSAAQAMQIFVKTLSGKTITLRQGQDPGQGRDTPPLASS